MQSYLKFSCSIVLVGLLGAACKKEMIINPTPSVLAAPTLSSGKGGNGPLNRSRSAPPRLTTSNEVPVKGHITYVSSSQNPGSGPRTPPPQVKYKVSPKGKGTSNSQTSGSKSFDQTSFKVSGPQRPK